MMTTRKQHDDKHMQRAIPAVKQKKKLRLAAKDFQLPNNNKYKIKMKYYNIVNYI
jgi:hypothetical protein